MDGVEFRCPEHPMRLLLRLGSPALVEGANTIEVSCRDCRNDRRKQGHQCSMVLYRFNVLGELVETDFVP